MKFFWIYFIFPYVFFAQNENNISKGLTLLEKSRTYYKKVEYDSAYFYGKESLKVFEDLKNDSLIAVAATELISASSKLKKSEFNDYFQLAEKKSTTSKNWKLLSTVYSKKAGYHYTKFEDDQAMLYFLKSDSILAANQVQNKITFNNLMNIVRILIYSGDKEMDSLNFRKAQGYLLRGFEIADKIGYDIGKVKVYDAQATILARSGKSSEAISFYHKALGILEKVDDSKTRSDMYWNIAAYYLSLKKMDSAEYYYKKRVPLFLNTNNKSELALTYSSLGGFYNKIERYDDGGKYQLKALKIYDSIKSEQIGNILGTLNGLAYSYANSQRYSKAYEILDRAYRMKDSLAKKQNRDITLELETKYQTEKKEQEITLLKSQNELAKQQKRNQRNLLLGGISLSTIAGLFFFFLYRNRQKTANKLQELDKAKSNFFANVSHEFRTPLTLISGPLQKRLKRNNLANDERDNLEMMYRNSTRLLSLVDQLLDISKIETGSLKLSITKQEMMPFIGTLMDGFTYPAKEKEINYRVNIHTTVDATFCDKDVIEKIVVNLISNAIKYTPSNGSIICTAFIKEQQLHFEVKNTGKGLSKEELTKVFDRFYQIDENKEGVGIGLALVKELVELHKGIISVESATNDWTTFNVTLPIDKESFNDSEMSEIHVSEEDIHLETRLELQTQKHLEISDGDFNDGDVPILLVVDDNDEVRTYVGNLFKNSYSIITAKNGEEGVDLAIEKVPDIIISDIMMPIKNGIELCNILKADERTSHIPIILLTAKAGEENEIEGIKTGADDYVTKPFHEDLLLLRVEKLVESRKNLQKRYSQEVILRPKDIAITPIDEQFLERMQKVLDEKLVESSFSIEDFSKAVGMSRMQLHRKLKALTGLSASEFIRSQRLKLAAQLLKKSEINVSQVGYSVGFNDHAYFSKCFREMYHTTPSAYAKLAKK